MPTESQPGSDATVTIEKVPNLLYHATGSPNPEAVEFLRNSYQLRISDLQIAAIRGDRMVIRRLLAQLGEPAKKSALSNGYLGGLLSNSPLALAVRNGHTDAVRELIAAGAEVNEYCIWTLTPLANAAERGHTDTVKLLLQQGAKVDAAPDAYTALMRACIGGWPAAAKLPLDAGADPNAKHGDGQRPLHFAAKSGSAECVKLLLKHGADPRAVAYGKDTALTRRTLQTQQHRYVAAGRQTRVVVHKRALVSRTGSNQETSTVKQKLLIQLAMVIAACVFLCGTVSSAGEASPAEIESDSPLNEENLATILDNRGKFTESDLMTMLGPPSSIEKYDSLSITLMNWEEVNRIEVKCRQGVVETVSGTFSPRLPSRIINDSAFKRLRPGMKANDVLREVFFGWQARIVRDSSAGTDTLVFEQFNRFHILLSDGKVRTATRVWQTDEHLNTPIVRNPPVAGQTEEAAVIRELRAAGNQFKVKDNAERSEGISRDDQIHFLRFSTVKSLAPLATHARNLTDLNVLTIFGDADLSDLTELPALRQLHLEDCNADLSVLPKLPHLRFLHLNNVKPRDFSFLAGLPQLVTLTIHENEFSDLSPVAKLTKLTSLSIAESQVNDLAPVAGLRNLDTFNAYRAPVRDLTPLARLHSLERLGLFGTKVEDLTPLAELTNLYWLSLGRTQVRDLSLLARWPKMKGLNLQQIPATDFSVLATLTNLEELDLEETQIEDLSPLKELVKLKSLKLARVPARDVSPLAGLVNLAYLSVPEVRDVSSLTGLKKLRGLSLAGTVSDPEVAKLQAALPRCRINRIGK